MSMAAGLDGDGRPSAHGREVFKHAVSMITDVIFDAFKATGTTADDLGGSFT
jgi:3-oxoacyl-[acyl-carrier-protein] synthase-3